MNRYKVKFQAVCPVNNDVIEYSLEIQTHAMIQVEHICGAVADCKKGFHEAFADLLHQKFGGKQIMIAVHGGVVVETERGI